MQTLKSLLSYYCQYSLDIHQMETELAFLNGKVLSEVYVREPQGYNGDSNRVYKSNKVLFGMNV